MSNILVYSLDSKVYINLTNRCTNDCIFCLRKDKDDVCGQELWLDSEDFAAQDVIEQLKNFELSSEVVFCGYGEPLLKFEILKEVAKYIKENYPDIKIRINTNGHANYVYKKNIVPELVGLIDEISVSLNGSTAEEYDELSQPKFENAYEEVKKFIKCCSDAGIKTDTSIVDGYKGRRLNVQKCEEISKDLGAKLRVREWIVNGYS
jgi:TatD family-associated radical SAM protein